MSPIWWYCPTTLTGYILFLCHRHCLFGTTETNRRSASSNRITQCQVSKGIFERVVDVGQFGFVMNRSMDSYLHLSVVCLLGSDRSSACMHWIWCLISHGEQLSDHRYVQSQLIAISLSLFKCRCMYVVWCIAWGSSLSRRFSMYQDGRGPRHFWDLVNSVEADRKERYCSLSPCHPATHRCREQ